ncbi:MAG: membrane protein insertase YidC [Actinobacteria bacterium]|nr:membrane protein insertase YidC [Actinomycetota bacterium]
MLGLFNAPVAIAYNIVLALTQLLTPVTGGLAAAAAIVIFTLAVRLLLTPLSFTALRGQASITALQPRIAELRAKYAHQPERLQRELSALYAAEGGGLLMGCLPLLLQLPFFSVIYRLLESATVAGRPNALLSSKLLAAPLGSHWLTGAGPASAQGLVFVGLFALLAIACFAAARLARSAAATQATTATPATAATPAAAAGLTRVTGVLPYLSVVIAAFVPLAAGLYLLISTAWSTAERAIWRRWTLRAGQRPATATPG